jgi:hypothetical protein
MTYCHCKAKSPPNQHFRTLSSPTALICRVPVVQTGLGTPASFVLPVS